MSIRPVVGRRETLLSRVDIRRFRAFEEFNADGLTRVNLFVGKNNAGKTCLLEAVELLRIGSPWGLFRSPTRRNEEIAALPEERFASPTELDVSHLFHGHTLPGAAFSLKGIDNTTRSVECSVIEIDLSASSRPEQTRLPVIEGGQASLALEFRASGSQMALIGLSASGGVTSEARRRLAPSSQDPPSPVLFLRPDLSNVSQIGYLWDRVVLTDEETQVVDALKIIEPRIERIGFVGDEGRSIRTRRVLIKLSDSDLRLPLGSVGDGLKRLLLLSLHLASAAGGCLLVDEIDTGLHFSVMANMWKLLIEGAHRLDVQVFATTHSLDCVRALAWVREQIPHRASEVTLHRIDKGLNQSIRFTMDEIAIASNQHVEVR